jgi:hypothetical protein
VKGGLGPSDIPRGPGSAPIGAAQDVTADDLRIETLFPADPQSEALFRGMATAVGR